MLFGVNYTRDFGEITLAASAGWTGADNENPSAGMTDQEEWSAGANLT